MKKKPTVWLARNKMSRDWRATCARYTLNISGKHHKERTSAYNIAIDAKLQYDKMTDTWYAVRRGRFVHKALLPFEFESIAPKPCHLKPGEGPIEITIDIKRKK